MPDRIFGKDEELNKHYLAEDMTGIEYADGHYVAVTCKRCKGRWAFAVGEMGEVPTAARNPLLAHASAHDTNVRQKRRPPLFKLPPVRS
jgi:hypothetical protein